jgi:hypothetical protein
MRRTIKPIFWTLLFLIMMLAIDQFFVQVPPVHPAHATVCDFYLDFRSRLIDLASGEKKALQKSIEAVIDTRQPDKKTAPKVKKPAVNSTKPVQKAQRYIYSDGKGELHFVDSLDEVPDKYRGQAQPMGQ